MGQYGDASGLVIYRNPDTDSVQLMALEAGDMQVSLDKSGVTWDAGKGVLMATEHIVIEVITEGVLTRILQDDPSLAGVGLIIFDEFHERSLDADLGLALCRDIQGVLNVDLRLLVMSATLDPAAVADLLDDYLHECVAAGILSVRIIHGKGIGVQREIVRSILERREDVLSFGHPTDGGSWGATVVELAPPADGPSAED